MNPVSAAPMQRPVAPHAHSVVPRAALHARLREACLTPFRDHEARQFVRAVASQVSETDRVLDLGSGIGHLGALLQRDLGCLVVGCDVVPMNVALDEFHLFDGLRVPFAARTFDVTLLAYVLHHVADPLRLLREATRVTRRLVIVVEDTPKCWADRLWGRLHVRSFNDAYGLPHGRVRGEDEWRALFAAAGLRLAERKSFGRLERFPPNARTQFALAPEGA